MWIYCKNGPNLLWNETKWDKLTKIIIEIFDFDPKSIWEKVFVSVLVVARGKSGATHTEK